MFRRKVKAEEPTIEFVTSALGLAEQWPIVPARKIMPQWYKDAKTRVPMSSVHLHGQPPPQAGSLPSSRSMSPTVRQCPGVVDVLRAGFVVRAWTDIEVTTQAPPTKDPNNPDPPAQSVTPMRPNEPGGRMGGFNPALNQTFPMWEDEYDWALKMDSPWMCKTPPGWSMLYLPMPYAEKTPWRVIHGVTDNDEFHVVNIVVAWSHVGTYLIEAGTPLCVLLPVRRDGFQMNHTASYDPDRWRTLRVLGKGGVGEEGTRLIHGSYVKERIRRQREVEEAE